MPHPYNNQFVRRDDHRPLPAGSRHKISVVRHRIPAVPVYPEESSIDRAFVGFPRGRNRAHEFREPSGQNSLALPHTVLKIKIPEPSPVAPRSKLVALGEEVSIRISFEHHSANADLVE